MAYSALPNCQLAKVFLNIAGPAAVEENYCQRSSLCFQIKKTLPRDGSFLTVPSSSLRRGQPSQERSLGENGLGLDPWPLAMHRSVLG